MQWDIKEDLQVLNNLIAHEIIYHRIKYGKSQGKKKGKSKDIFFYGIFVTSHVGSQCRITQRYVETSHDQSDVSITEIRIRPSSADSLPTSYIFRIN